jgi:hypothetical protein
MPPETVHSQEDHDYINVAIAEEPSPQLRYTSGRTIYVETLGDEKWRGLDPARTYRVTFDSLATSVQIDGLRLQQDGLVIRLENVGMSELLLFEE